MTSANLTLLNSLAYLLSQQGAQGGGGGKQQKKVKYCSATCPDPQCRTKLYFPSHEASVECTNCGQRHTVKELPDKKEVSEKDREGKFGVELAQLKQLYSSGKRTPELVKVKGISNYQCKLLSQLLTTHGMDSKTEQAKPLRELGMGDTFDCSKLANRVFAIEENQLNTMGYGRDRSGSMKYLGDTLKQLKLANQNQECLVPVHADGDGHCLVHAISRCLVGRELFWHALRTSLHLHLDTNQHNYKEMFKDFYSEEEWPDIIAEAGPDYQPPDGQALGLRNIHIFGLANVLRRPIILLDSLSGMQSCGDYSGIFLPALYSPDECCSKDPSGSLKPNSPIVIAWSNSGRNHFIPLVPIKGKPLPKLPLHLVPKPWGLAEEKLQEYVSLDADGCIELYGGKTLGDGYLQKLVACMERVFFEKNAVVPSLVADVNQYVFKSAGYSGVSHEIVTDATKSAVEESRLFRCLICSAVSCVPPHWLRPGGQLYDKALDRYDLEDGMMYKFPIDGVVAKYDATSDSFIPSQVACFWCANHSRLLQGNGAIVYENGDRTQTQALGSKCGCGYKHYWDGDEYDNLPEKIPLQLTWAGRTVPVTVYWFQYESDPTHNSNVYEVAQKVVTDHFPGEFGSERLVQSVVDQILTATERRENIEQVTGHHPKQEPRNATEEHAMQQDPPSPVPPTKFILTGQKSKTFHKEELTMSETERNIKKRIEENARIQQQRKKASQSKKVGQGARVSPPPPSPRTPPPRTPPPHPSPPSPSIGKPAQKKIRVTSSDGKTANLTLEPSVTFSELQTAIERELSIPPERQRLRSGYPPRELRPSEDPSHPVDLANGERVSVDVISHTPSRDVVGGAMEVGGSPSARPRRTSGSTRSAEQQVQQSLNTLLQQVLGGEMDLWAIAQHQPQLFQKGGDYYEQVIQTYGEKLKDHTHFQFKEFTNKTFAYNAQSERLDICLGQDHIPVRPLSSQEEQLAQLASVAGIEKTPQSHPSQEGEGSAMGLSGAINKPSASSVKAFSGRGHTLMEPTPSRGAESQDPLLEAAQLVVQKRLITLQSRERELQTQVRAMNRQIVQAEANKDGASVRDDVLTSLETKLLDSSSELKKVREEIKELTTLQ